MAGTDYTVNYAETNEGGVRLVCILQEGNITVSDDAFSPTGLKNSMSTLADELKKGEWVALDSDAHAKYEDTGGWPVMKKLVDSEDLAIGKIVDEPRWHKIPEESFTDDLDDKLEKGYYRIATVFIPSLCGVTEAIYEADGSNAVAPGSSNLALKAADSAGKDQPIVQYDGSGTGLIALTACPSGTNEDTHNVLLGFTGGVLKVNA